MTIVDPIRVDIDLGPRSYPIHIGAGLLGGRWAEAALRSDQVLVVTNEVVAPLYLERVLEGLDGRRVETLILPDGEVQKNASQWQAVLDRLTQMGALRDVALVALGGGVIGDLTGFAAATYMRGVDFIQLPTTLLAQVDAAVGGKTAINHPLGKNLIGAFHQPRCVIIDTETLATLPPREYRAGLAEVIKYGLIRDAGFFEWLLQQRDALLALDPTLVAETIARCCRHKAEIVAADETEGGIRALLNLGHTFGHAVESLSEYQLLHGEAVAIGCCLAARLSARLGTLSESDAQRVSGALAAFGLPTTVPAQLDPEAIVARMQLDKKNRAGRIHLVLLDAIGAATVDAAPPNEELVQLVTDSIGHEG